MSTTKTNENPRPPLADAIGSEHPAFKRTWWVNLYPDGQCTGTLCETRESARNRCTWTGETPDATQVEVRIIPNDRGQAQPPTATEADIKDTGMRTKAAKRNGRRLLPGPIC